MSASSAIVGPATGVAGEDRERRADRALRRDDRPDDADLAALERRVDEQQPDRVREAGGGQVAELFAVVSSTGEARG